MERCFEAAVGVEHVQASESLSSNLVCFLLFYCSRHIIRAGAAGFLHVILQEQPTAMQRWPWLYLRGGHRQGFLPASLNERGSTIPPFQMKIRERALPCDSQCYRQDSVEAPFCLVSWRDGSGYLDRHNMGHQFLFVKLRPCSKHCL